MHLCTPIYAVAAIPDMKYTIMTNNCERTPILLAYDEANGHSRRENEYYE